MAVRLDKVLMSSLHESFKNYDTQTVSITISGSIPTNGKGFSQTLSFARTGTIADIYYRKQGGSFKRPVSNLRRVPEYTGATNAEISVRYTATSITIEIFVINFGSPYTAPTETYDFEVKLFDAPISS